MQPIITDLPTGRMHVPQSARARLDDDQLWSLSKVCDALSGVSDDTFHRLVKRQEFRRIKQGRCTYVLASEVRAYIARFISDAK